MKHDAYVNPLCTRYASREMQHIFSQDKKFSTWRKLWIALAETEKELAVAKALAPVEKERDQLVQFLWSL